MKLLSIIFPAIFKDLTYNCKFSWYRWFMESCATMLISLIHSASLTAKLMYNEVQTVMFLFILDTIFIPAILFATEEYIDLSDLSCHLWEHKPKCWCYKGEECKFPRTDLTTMLRGQLPIILLLVNKLMSFSLIPLLTIWYLWLDILIYTSYFWNILEVMMIQGFLLAHEYDIQSDMFNICPATWDLSVWGCQCEECQFLWPHLSSEIMLQLIIHADTDK